MKGLDLDRSRGSHPRASGVRGLIALRMQRLVLVALTGGCLAQAGAAPAPARTPAREQPLGCLIEAERSAEVGASIVGTIETVEVERGDPVRKGQVLAQMRSDVERANVEAARLRSANEGEIQSMRALRAHAMERARSTTALFNLGGAGATELEQARTEFDSADGRYAQALQNQRTAKAEYQVALAQLTQRTIRAPFDGVVVDRLVQPGERVDGKPMFRVVALTPLRVELVAPTALYGELKEGMKVDVTPEYPTARTVVGQVARIDRQVDAASGTFRARLTLPNPQGDIPTGLRCKVSW